MALNSDPLADSDEEKPDENLLLDYSEYRLLFVGLISANSVGRRLDVLSRIRGRPPTPDLTPPQEQHFYTARLP